MHKVLAFGGCHILSGYYKNQAYAERDITVDKSIPCQLNNKTSKSIQLLHHYLKANTHNQITIVFQTGNIGFSNSIGNIIGFGTGRKVVRSIIPVTLNDNEFLQQTIVSKSSKPGIKTWLKLLVFFVIVPVNFIIINLCYIPRLLQLKRELKKHNNITKVLVLTPFNAFCNFHWIFRKYGVLIYSIIFRSEPIFDILNTYSLTADESLFTDDKLHLNSMGYQILNQAISNKLFTTKGIQNSPLLNMAI